MAGGDHLHFGVILSGLPVQPLEWLDPRWIKHNITDRLER
jgi:murein DD-endopeptidase MepM/ murein hydrolase activator NlpD